MVDRTLRQWDRWCSLAEGVGSSVPDAHRSARGHRYDPLTHADRVADVEKAMVFALRQWSLEWNVVDHRRRGFTFLAMAQAMHLSKTTVHEGYWAAVRRMAAFLGWVEEDPDASVPELC
jgi:hypothetical protein